MPWIILLVGLTQKLVVLKNIQKYGNFLKWSSWIALYNISNCYIVVGLQKLTTAKGQGTAENQVNVTK